MEIESVVEVVEVVVEKAELDIDGVDSEGGRLQVEELGLAGKEGKLSTSSTVSGRGLSTEGRC